MIQGDRYAIHQGDVMDVLRTFPDNHFTCSITDPPYGLGETPDMTELLTYWLADKHYDTKKGFMGKAWDVVPGPAVWKEVYRVLRPGGILMAFGGTRTADLLSIAIRLAGFERFDEISYHHTILPGRIDWVTGSGFPKSFDISKAIDRECGAEREVVGQNQNHRPVSGVNYEGIYAGGNTGSATTTAPATDAARTWAGYQTALKPAHEPILLFRKPRTQTYAQTAITHGTACLNIDGTRIPTDDKITTTWSHSTPQDGWDRPWRHDPEAAQRIYERKQAGAQKAMDLGRWPANVIFDSESAALLDEMSGESASPLGMVKGQRRSSGIMGKPDGNHESMTGYGDQGGASRYFFVIKGNHPCGQEKTRDGDMFAGKKTASSDECSKVDGCGSKPTGLFLTDTISITLTETRLIISFPILSVSSDTIIGTCTIDAEKPTETLTESSIVNVNVAPDGNHLMTFRNGKQVLIKGTAKIVNVNPSENGETKTENTTELTPENTITSTSNNLQVLPTFIYQAKSPQAERSAGLNGNGRQRDVSRNTDQPSMNGGEGNPYNRGAVDVKNFHPCVKPVTLTEYLARLIVPPKEYRADARILVPFSGSGSEMIGALLAGWLNVDGIELDEDYIAIAEQRLAHWQDELSVEPRRINGRTTDYADSPLFAELAT